ncbi:glutamine synthetase [Acrasis kona]|uniref:glutamine synthetase n=1 Tax=Acrasis kona TaxID=1008807 RepID=A0AAW2YYF5_9EUKA
MNIQPRTFCIANYIWIDDDGLKGKSKTLDKRPEKLSDLSDWSFACGRAENSEQIIKPRAVFRDPFLGDPHVLVLCDRYNSDGTPHEKNYRFKAQEVFDRTPKDQHPWYGLEQEYVMVDTTTGTKLPLGFAETAEKTPPQGPHYCGVGAGRVFGRDLADEHYKYCLDAGVKLCGINAELLHGQWEFQVGICEGIEAGDHMWMARYILSRLGEKYNIAINYDPKPVEGDQWSASGMHCNFSTQPMRVDGGMSHIMTATEALREKHKEHIIQYGDNKGRMLGESADNFTLGIGNRSCSVRVTGDVASQGKGYLEDRRPSSNADPYIVSMMLADTVCVEKETPKGSA